MEERGVPVQDDWSIAPEDDRVRFSLSGVTPHSWGEREEACEGQGPGEGGGHREARGPQRQETTCRAGAVFLLSSLPCSPGLEGLPPRGDANFSQHTLPGAQHLLGPCKDWSSGDTGHPAAVTREHPGFPGLETAFLLKENTKPAEASLPARWPHLDIGLVLALPTSHKCYLCLLTHS